jgi:cobalt/nickel transport system permease protein
LHEEPLTLAAPPRDLLERIDPRVKIVCLLVWAVCVVTIPVGQMRICAAYAVLLALLLIANVPLWGKFLRRFGAVLPFVLLVVVLLPFLRRGEALWGWGRLEVSREGLWTALRVGTAAALCIAGMALFWASTSESRLLAGLRGLAVPDTVVNVFGFMLRYLDVLRPELHRLTDARSARTIGKHGPGALRSGANVVGALFIRAHDRAQRVADAMVSRGFTGRGRDLYHRHWHLKDVAAGLGFVGLVVLLRLAVRG